MDHGSRRKRLAGRLRSLEVDAFLSTHLPNVRYLTGFTGSNGQVLVSAAGSILFTDGRYEEQARREAGDVDLVIYEERPAGALASACRDLGVNRVGFESSAVSYKGFQELSAELELVPLEDEVGKLRWVKDSRELALIERAQEITDTAFAASLPQLVEGMSERRFALVLNRTMEDLGAEGLAFETIVAFGESAAEQHHQPAGRELRRGDVVKLDLGARVDGYHSDMTRTVAFGDLGEELRLIYGLVRQAQEAGIAAVGPGVEGMRADAAARGVIADGGYSFGHGLGHGVGLEIHEGPVLRKKSSDVLPVGAVVTVEPGVYVPGLGGVRIEDMVEVTAGGCRSLTSSPKELVIL